MRPIVRPNGNYYAAERTNYYLPGANNMTRAMALCCKAEYDRLGLIIAGIGGATQAMAIAIDVAVVLAGVSVVDSGLVIAAVGAAGFGGGTYAQAIAAIAVNDQKLVHQAIHYHMILINLSYNIGANTFPGPPSRLYICHVPYVASAMLDAIEGLRVGTVANAGCRLYSLAGGTAVTAVPGMALTVVVFNLAGVRTQYAAAYNMFSTGANAGGLPYTDAAAELVSNLGPYCAYCEANLKTQIDVEHVLPKGVGLTVTGLRQGFSAFSKEWLNFLPSCPRCNSTKNARPSKTDITTQAAGVAFTKNDQVVLGGGGIALGIGGGGDTRLNEWEHWRIMPSYYQLPTEAASYQNLGFVLWDVTNNIVDNTARAAQVTWTINSVDEINKYVVVNVPGTGLVNYRLLVDNTGGAATVIPTAVAAQAKVANMVTICGLNTFTANTDRRVLERTEAYFMALETIRELTTALGVLPGGTNAAFYNNVYDVWRSHVMKIIKEKGFLSVWLKVFSAFAHPLTANGTVPTFGNPLPVNHVNGAAGGAQMTLVQDIANMFLVNQARYFPNTNWAQVP